MRVTKKGNVKLEQNEVRVGNFFVKCEDDHIKIQDLNGVFSFRANRRMAIGIWLENVWSRAMNGDEGGINTLKTYVATMWSVFSVAPDDEYIADALQMAGNAWDRHPEWYGGKREETDAENAEAETEVREMMEFEEEVRSMPDGIPEEGAADGE